MLAVFSQAAIILSASVTFMAIPGLDDVAKLAALLAILASTASMASTVLALFRYKLDIERTSYLYPHGSSGGEGLVGFTVRFARSLLGGSSSDVRTSFSHYLSQYRSLSPSTSTILRPTSILYNRAVHIGHADTYFNAHITPHIDIVKTFIEQRRSILMSLPLVFLAWAVAAFVTGITLYSFRGLSFAPHMMKARATGYTQWTVVCTLGGIAGVLLTSAVFVR
jgi:hypothetical protein